MNNNNKIQKLLFLALLFLVLISFAMSRFITETGLIAVCGLAFAAALSGEKTPYTLAAVLATLSIVLQFAQILPSPYNFLFLHGISMGPAIVITLLVAAVYVVIPVWLVFRRFSKKKDNNS